MNNIVINRDRFMKKCKDHLLEYFGYYDLDDLCRIEFTLEMLERFYNVKIVYDSEKESDNNTDYMTDYNCGYCDAVYDMSENE